MAQLKNMFVKGKMNLDLDERLIPKGEYRKAQNILITNSEDSDVGAIENVRGNELVGDTSLNLGNGIEDTGVCIGSYVDVAKERIFWFITNFTSTQPESGINNVDRASSSHNENCRIIMREKTGSIHVLVDGVFLNLTTTHHITGVNVVGNYLYWTDNYNQPRYIDIELAKSDGSYYNCEDKISVAKVAPFLPPFLHNSNEASSNANLGDTYTLVTTDPDTSSQHTKSEYMEEKFIRFAYRYKYSDNTYSIISPFTQSVFKPLANGEMKFGSTSKTGSNSAAGQLAFEPVVSSSIQYMYTHGNVPIMQNAYDKVIMRIPIPTCSDNGIISEHNTAANQISSNSYPNLLKIDSIEILLREAGTNSIQIVDTIDLINTAGLNFGRYKQKIATSGGFYYRQTVEYTYLARDPFKVLPEKQLIRVGDNAPVRAKAQEVVGSRLVYGNITLGYDLPRDEDNKKGIKFFVTSGPKGKNEQSYTANSIGHYFHNHEQYKFHNIKQRRTYQVGIVLVDRYGRTSPVIPSTYKTTNLGDTHTVDAVTADLSVNFNNGSADVYSWSDTGLAYGQALSVEFPDSRIVETNRTYNRTDRPNGWYSWRIVVKQVEQDYYNVYTEHPMNNWTVEDATTTSFTGYRDQHIKGKFSTAPGSKSWFTLSNDNINKVPRSIKNFNDDGRDFGVNRDGFGRLISSSNEGLTGSEEKLYPKVVQKSSTIAGRYFDSEMGDPQQDYINVLSIGSAIDQGLSSLSNAKRDDGQNNANSVQDSLYEDRPRPYSFLADNHKNPLVAEIPNLYLEPVAVSGEFNVNGSDVIRTTNNNLSNMPFGYPKGKDRGLTVFETKPFESNIDIYYETSSCGLVRDLNEHCDFANQGPTNIRITPTFQESSFTAGLAANILEEAKFTSTPGQNHAQVGALTATPYNDGSNPTITSFEILACSNGFNDGNDLSKFSIAFEDDKSFVKISSVQNTQAAASSFNLSTGGTVLRLDYKNIRNLTAASTNFVDAAPALPSAFDTDGFYRIIYYLGQHSSANNNEMIKQCIVIQVANNEITNFFSSNLTNTPTNINQQFMLKTNDLFAFQNNNSRDVFNITLRAIQSNQITGTENITVTITNSKPTANSHASILIPSTTTAGPGGGKNLATLTAVNGSADPLNNTFGLTSTVGGTNASSFELNQNQFAPGNFILGASSTFNFSALFGTPNNGVYPSSPSINWQVEDNGGLNSLADGIATSISFIGIQVVNVQGFHSTVSGAEACTGVQTQTLTSYSVTRGSANTMYTQAGGLQVGNKVYTNNNLTQTPGAGFIAIAVGSGHKSYAIDASGAITSAGTTCITA